MVALIHLADYVPDYPGSFVPMVREALVRARSRGWRATAVFPEEAGGRRWARDLAGEFEVRFLPPSRSAVAALLRPGETAILHTSFTLYDLAAALAARGHANVHVVWHAQSNLVPTAAGRARSLLKYTASRRLVDAVVCVAPHVVEQVVRAGASRRRTLYVPNAVDTGRFSPRSPRERAEARAALGLPGDRPVVLHYGWAWRRKGGDLLCAAVGELAGRGVEVTAVTVGAGAAAEADARRCGIEDRLVRLPQTQHVEQLLAAADVLALPSRAEGMPFAVVEALASGVPVVAGDIPGATVAGELAAYRAVPLEPGAIADGIAAQLRATEAARAAGRAYVEAEWSLTTWGDRVYGLYDAILAYDR